MVATAPLAVPAPRAPHAPLAISPAPERVVPDRQAPSPVRAEPGARPGPGRHRGRHRAPRRGLRHGPSRRSAPRPRRQALDHLLTVTALLGVAVTLLTVAVSVSGLRPLVVKSGSMEPTIATGGMVLVREVPASRIRVGDVVAVQRPDRTRVTHRVTAVTLRGGVAELVLKGDANEDVDPAPVSVRDAGLMVWSAPWLGRVSAFVTSPRGGFALGCLVTAVALSVLRRRED